MKKLYLIIGLCAPLFHFGQNSLGDRGPEDLTYFEYFQKEQYHEVVRSLQRETYLNPNQELILLLSFQKTGEPKGDEIKTWMADHPDHPLKSLAAFNYAQLRFAQGDTAASKRSLSTINHRKLAEKDQATFGYLSGVMSLNDGQYAKALKHFKLAEAKGYHDQVQLTYYQSFISYHQNKYQEALKGFSQMLDDPNYGVSSRYFMAKIYLESEDYEKVIDLAQGELSEDISLTSSGFYQLLGEAYAYQNDLAKADAFFEKAIEKHPSRPSPDLYYQAGVSKFKIGNEEKALSYLTESGIGKGTYARLSAFQLGRLYIRRNELEKALSAYMESSSSDDLQIKEESLYQSAMLNAKLERFPEAIRYCEDYLERFAEGQWVGAIESLLAKCYLKTSDYDQAISQLEKRGIRNETQRGVYQKLTYQQGLQKFNDAQFDAAVVLFDKSQQYPVDAELVNDANFHLAEIYLQRENYQEALQRYRRVEPLSPEASYGMGFAYYNRQLYQEAIPHFRKGLLSASEQTRQDALLRLADCYYATKSYELAVDAYSRLPQNDYVSFQQAMVNRNLERNQRAVSILEEINVRSSYKDDAMFFIGQIAFENGEFEIAEERFTSLMTQFPENSYAARAFLNRGITRNNLQKYDAAKSDYIHVIENYLQNEEAFSAILGLQDLQQKGVQVSGIERFIRDYKKANPGDGSLEVVEFESAKGTYFDLNYGKAIDMFKAFLQEYPESKFRTEAVYYLGDSHYRSNQLQESREVFADQRFVRNTYTGRILNRLGAINLALGDYADALEDYELLLSLNLSPKDNYNARKGAMQGSFLQLEYPEAIKFADEILGAEWMPLNAEKEAKLLKAKSLYQMQQLNDSKALFSELAKGEDQFAAEAAYTYAYIAYEEAAYDESLDALFELTSRLGSYTEWIDKSYLLIADNYIGKDELFQAKATLRSIVQHSKDLEVKRIAQEKLDTIEQTTELDTLTEGN